MDERKKTGHVQIPRHIYSVVDKTLVVVQCVRATAQLNYKAVLASAISPCGVRDDSSGISCNCMLQL